MICFQPTKDNNRQLVTQVTYLTLGVGQALGRYVGVSEMLCSSERSDELIALLRVLTQQIWKL